MKLISSLSSSIHCHVIKKVYVATYLMQMKLKWNFHWDWPNRTRQNGGGTCVITRDANGWKNQSRPDLICIFVYGNGRWYPDFASDPIPAFPYPVPYPPKNPIQLFQTQSHIHPRTQSSIHQRKYWNRNFLFVFILITTVNRIALQNYCTSHVIRIILVRRQGCPHGRTQAVFTFSSILQSG